MRQVRLISALALILGAALFISACGGDDSPETPITVPTTATTSDLSKDEFIEEADAICEEANASIGQFVAAGEGFTEGRRDRRHPPGRPGRPPGPRRARG